MKTAFTPGGLIRLALLMFAAFVLAHIAGLRVHTSVLCSTLQEGTGWFAGRLFAMLYVVTYLLAVFVAPVFTLAGALLWIWERRLTRS